MKRKGDSKISKDEIIKIKNPKKSDIRSFLENSQNSTENLFQESQNDRLNLQDTEDLFPNENGTQSLTQSPEQAGDVSRNSEEFENEPTEPGQNDTISNSSGSENGDLDFLNDDLEDSDSNDDVDDHESNEDSDDDNEVKDGDDEVKDGEESEDEQVIFPSIPFLKHFPVKNLNFARFQELKI